MNFKLLPQSVSHLKMHFLKDDRFLQEQSLFDVYYGHRPTVHTVLIEAFSIKQAQWALSAVKCSFSLDLRIISPISFSN